MHTSRHCSMDSGAWTDLISNATMLTTEERDDPRPWLGELPGGARHVAAYVHESTHHWCFNSIVGNALFALAARAESNAQAYLLRRAATPERDQSPELDAVGEALGAVVEEQGGLGCNGAPLTDEERDVDPWLVLDDVVRLQVTVRLLRPLAEGLALFAEHDAVPRVNSRVGSHLAKDLAFYFEGVTGLISGNVVIEPFATLAAAGGVLRDSRLSADGLASKASLLAQPLSSGAQGYLPGYLTIKSIWWQLSRQDARLATETDLVLTYLRSYFYEDPGLVALLLAPPEPDPVVSANRIADHLARRLADIERVTADDVTAFEDSVLQYVQSGTRLPTKGILADAGRDRAIPLFIATVRALDEGPRRELLGESITRATQRLLLRVWDRRSHLTVSSVPVTLRVLGWGVGAEVVWREELLFHADASDLTPHAAPGTYEARLEVILTTAMAGQDLMCRGAFVTAQGRLLSCTMNRHASDELRQKMLDLHQEREALVDAGKRLSAFTDAVVDHTAGLSALLSHIMRHTVAVTDSLYRETALWPARDSAVREGCARLMAEEGLFPLLGSPRLLTSLALLGLSTGLYTDRARVTEEFTARGLDLKWTLEQLDAVWDTHGYPPPVPRTAARLLCPL
ncbi:hypothetical protein ACFU53_10770 [Streptomyces sp. NPDC057474]|uniref:hypothetical protein n=1 Tax=Streptomyces sp. NPDC057474 TaxID=3346144 RepID=UPI00369CB66E